MATPSESVLVRLRLCRDGDYDIAQPDQPADLIGIPKEACYEPHKAMEVVRQLCAKLSERTS